MRTVKSVIAASLLSLPIAFVASSASAAEPVQEVVAGEHTHDGFYMRLGAGYGYMTTSSSVTGQANSASIKGVGPAFQMSFGGTPIPGLVIAGTMFMHLQSKPSVDLGNGQSADANSSVFLLSLGPIVDYYPDPHGGLHFGGGPLFSTFNGINYTSTGFGATVFGGYDLWIGKSWSFGPALQYNFSHASKDPETDTSNSIAVMLSFTDH